MDSASRLPFRVLDGTSNAHFSLTDSTRNPTTLPLKLVLQRDILLTPSVGVRKIILVLILLLFRCDFFGFMKIQELLLIDDLLSVLVGIEGRYISLKRVRRKESLVTFRIDASVDLALQEMTKWIFPICENFLAINQFVESRSHFKNGLVNHAFAAAIRALLLGDFLVHFMDIARDELVKSPDDISVEKLQSQWVGLLAS